MAKKYIIKILNFCSVKDTVKKLKREATELGENIFKTHN